MYWIRSLVHINSTCIMAEKMALILLDYLFIKDMLATSNLSSTSWWKEQQLNPLMMFGIRCYQQYKFNMNLKLWHKICQSMDSTWKWHI
ncbi:protein BANP-like [Scylla paramamosain]|uniref:protein BANP-like n=1 Tax=Scylla paramamosain TaxID=85552 RepID=UPI003082E988